MKQKNNKSKYVVLFIKKNVLSRIPELEVMRELEGKKSLLS